jgi:hypothetical protein
VAVTEKSYVGREHVRWDMAPGVRISSNIYIRPPPWPSWQGESGVQSFDLDGVGSIPAIPPTQFTCFIDEFNRLA